MKRNGLVYWRCNWFFLLTLVLATGLLLNSNPALGQGKKPLVDLNSASEEVLESLPGVGPATAKKIVAARPFKSLDDLKNAGMSAKAIEKLKPLVTIGAVETKSAAPAAAATPAAAKSAATEKKSPGKATESKPPAVEKKPSATAAKLAPGEKVNINSAGKEKLEALPEIGPALAQAIIDGRPYTKIEDVMKVKGIKEGKFSKIKDLISIK